MTRAIKNILFAIFILGALFSCSKGDDNDNNNPPPTFPVFKATLTGVQEDPPNSSTASGEFISTYNTSSRILSYTITFRGLTPIGWHIHKGAIGVSGPVEINLGSTFTSGFSSTTTLTSSQETDLYAGNYYVNIHTSIFTGGEIRGQLLRQ